VNEREPQWADWLRAANAGDAAAYERLLRDVAVALRPAVRRGLLRGGRSADDAEDVVQEVLIAVHVKRHTWDPARPVGPWLRAIAQYKLIDALRRRGSRGHVPIEDVLETLPAESAEPAISERDVQRHLDGLPTGQRAVVSAIALDGASIGETARRLSMTPGAVRVALHRALAAIARKSGLQSGPDAHR
jgi:RNA polymerase sigma-70 factor (ECF subfamily)